MARMLPLCFFHDVINWVSPAPAPEGCHFEEGRVVKSRPFQLFSVAELRGSRRVPLVGSPVQGRPKGVRSSGYVEQMNRTLEECAGHVRDTSLASVRLRDFVVARGSIPAYRAFTQQTQ
jgi:hypothetical protein